MVAVSAYTLLSKMYITVYTAFMQIYANMLRIRKTGNTQTRTNTRTVSGGKENIEMSSLGRKWL